MRQLFKFIFGDMEKNDEEKLKEITRKNGMEMTEKSNNCDMSNALQLIDQLKKEILDCGNSTLVDSISDEQEIVEVRID